MIDIHCHILPEFDDGASSPEEAIAMAHMAADSGVTAIVTTPHFPGKADSLVRIPALLGRFEWLRRAVRSQRLPLKIYPGAEILCLPDTLDLAKDHTLPTIGNTVFLLTEFYFDESFSQMSRLLEGLSKEGYIPVVAHPERYHAVQEDPKLLKQWYEKGYVLQLNKGSILGSFGPEPEEAAAAMLEMGLAHLIASDAHSVRRRTPHMGALGFWMEENCDPDYARLLLAENAARLLAGKRPVYFR